MDEIVAIMAEWAAEDSEEEFLQQGMAESDHLLEPSRLSF